MTTTLDVSEAQEQLAHLLALARAGGEVIIAEGDTPVARLAGIQNTAASQNAAPAPVPKPRAFNLHEGAIWTSDDFDAPLPDAFWLGEEE